MLGVHLKRGRPGYCLFLFISHEKIGCDLGDTFPGTMEVRRFRRASYEGSFRHDDRLFRAETFEKTS